jgi:cytochrome c556
MTHFRSAFAAAFLVVGGAVVASAQQTAPAAPGHGRHGQFAQRADSTRRGLGVRNLRGQLFKGITLSDAEKANIKNVQAKYAPQMKALREQFKPQLQAARDARQHGDTAALKGMWQKSAAEREQAKKLLEAERNDLRAALTPENQVKFDANVQRFEQRVAKRAENGWKKGGRRAPGQKGPRA